MNYVARKRFKYDGKILEPGDVWTPAGGKFDESIKRHFVIAQEVEQPKTQTKRGRTRKAS